MLSLSLLSISQIHTISFNCESAPAIDFLRQLSLAHHGRFHFFERQPKDEDSPYYYDFKTGLLYDNSARSIEGNVTSEDLDLLENEIQVCLRLWHPVITHNAAW